MIFNSPSYAVFFAVLTGVWWLKLGWTPRKLLLIAFSYAFYAAWYPPTIVLLWASTLFDWFVTRRLLQVTSPLRRRLLVVGSLILNLGLLGFFKYGAFFAHNLNLLFGKLGVAQALPIPHPLLPVGISFYTFMSLSYVIDVYRGTIRPARSFVDFALFLTFYPHLVAGPIVRGHDFLGQCETERRPTTQEFVWGLCLLIFGVFQKMILADAVLAPIADRVFAPGASAGFRDAWLGTLAFSGQILCDFAGYSTCAIGAAACLGFRLPENFRAPYAALGLSDFWRRWHISLSSWLRDYLYISLGGNRLGTARALANLMLTMLLGGLWHGASWNFVIWGALHGLYLWLERGARGLWARGGGLDNVPGRLLVSLATFVLVSFAWVFFRAPDLSTALTISGELFHLHRGRPLVRLNGLEAGEVLLTVGSIVFLHHRFKDVSLEDVADRAPRYVICAGLVVILFSLFTMSGEDRAFIYFQF